MIKHTILCVDDENDNVEALERLFRQKYKILKATSGPEALKILDQYPDPIALIITDQRMPEMTGVEFLAKSLESRPESVRILLTGYTDIESVITAVNSGQIYRYITKPWDPIDLMNTVHRAVERFEMSQELKEKNVSLAAALAELQTLDQAKNQFMILINHELKTPLTGVLSFGELLQESKLDEEQKVYINRIQKNALRLKSLIEDSLLIVSGETRTLKTRIQPFDCHLLDALQTKDLKSHLQKKQQQLTCQWVDKKVVGDQNLILQVLERIAHNAVKFASEGSEIRIQCEQMSSHRLNFSVFNEGSSISEKVIGKILKPFYLDEDVMNHSAGTGLGLTVCQAILKSHNSALKIENLSAGVRVSFELACL